MTVLKYLYEKIKRKPAPYYYDYSLLTIIAKPIRKFIAQVLAPNCPFSGIRILLYKICGFKIGKHCFIGMRCYLDDMCYDLLTIGNNCTISYGVYFACHGRKQGHYPITIEQTLASDVKPPEEYPSALVNKNIPSGATAVGVPCRIIKG